MSGRFPELIPEELDKGEWSVRLGRGIKRWMQSIQTGMGGLQGTPATPSRVEAGATADVGVSQAVAASDHIHDAATASPSVPIALAGPAAEGTGVAFMRADATNFLAQGGAASGQFLMWNGTAWVPTSLEDTDIMNWLNL